MENPKVFIRPAEGGEWKEIKGVAKIDGIQNESEQGESKLAETRSWSAKVKIKRKDIKKLRSLRETFCKIDTDILRAIKYLNQASKFLSLQTKVERKNPKLAEYYQHLAELKKKRSDFYAERWQKAKQLTTTKQA